MKPGDMLKLSDEALSMITRAEGLGILDRPEPHHPMDSIVVRSDRDSIPKAVGVLGPGDTCLLLALVNDYALVMTRGRFGWIKARYVEAA
jgi:hypothetical protein